VEAFHPTFLPFSDTVDLLYPAVETLHPAFG